MNAHQLIDRPTRVTMTSRSLLDVVMVSNKDIVKTSGVLDLTISDHYLSLHPPTSTRSFKNYTADQFPSDIAHVPWETVELMDSVDDKVNACNDLFLTYLDNHDPIKTLKVKPKSNPSITAEIKKRIKKRNKFHKRARKSGSHEDWKVFADLSREIKQSIRQAKENTSHNKLLQTKVILAPCGKPYVGLSLINLASVRNIQGIPTSWRMSSIDFSSLSDKKQPRSL